MKLFNSITSLLDNLGVQYDLIEHKTLLNSNDTIDCFDMSEGESLKSLAISMDSEACVVTLLDNERLDMNYLKRIEGVKKISFIKLDKIQEQLGTEIGGISPFGYPKSIKLFMTKKAYRIKNPMISPGRNDLTVKMKTEDYKKIVDALGIKII